MSMSYVTLKEILKGTRENRYAVGAFNFNSYEDLQGIINGALRKKSPVIVMASMGAVKYIGARTTAYMVRGIAEAVSIPVCLHLDHATDMELIRTCIDLGFTSVMIDASADTYEDNIQKTKEIVRYASSKGCSVEAELGRIGGREEHISVDEDSAFFTAPDTVPRFVKETGIDALAIAFGTAHGFYKKEPKLDFERIRTIAKITEIPLVMHGGTGVSIEGFRKGIEAGISKVNVGTELKAAYVSALRDAVTENPQEGDPRKYMKCVKERCCKIVEEKLEIFGCAGRG